MQNAQTMKAELIENIVKDIKMQGLHEGPGGEFNEVALRAELDALTMEALIDFQKDINLPL